MKNNSKSSRDPYQAVSLKKSFVKMVHEHIERNPQYNSVADFVRISVINQLNADRFDESVQLSSDETIKAKERMVIALFDNIVSKIERTRDKYIIRDTLKDVLKLSYEFHCCPHCGNTKLQKKNHFCPECDKAIIPVDAKHFYKFLKDYYSSYFNKCIFFFELPKEMRDILTRKKPRNISKNTPIYYGLTDKTDNVIIDKRLKKIDY